MRVQDQESNVGTFTPRLPPVPRQPYGSSHPPTQLNGGAPPQQQQQQQQPGVRAPPAPAPAASSPGTAAAAPPRRGCLRANDTQCGWGRGKWGRGNADGGSPCGLKRLGRSIFSLVCFLILFKVAKCAASIAAFFLGWIVLPAGGMVLSLGAAVIWRLLTTVFYGLFFAFAVWRFTWLVGICYQIGTATRKHWLKRYEYVAAGKLWFTFKKVEWDAKRRLRQQQCQQRRQAWQQQQQQQAQSGPPSSSPVAPPSTVTLSPQPQQQQQQQRQQQQQQQMDGFGGRPTFTAPAPSAPTPAPAYAAPSPSAPQQAQVAPPAPPAPPAGDSNPTQSPPDFLNFLGAMNNQIAEYDRAYGLPAGTGLQLLQQQQQQQQQQQEGGGRGRGLYPDLDNGAQQQAGTGTVVV